MCGSEHGKMPSSKPRCAIWRVSGPCSLPTKRITWVLPNLLQHRVSQHGSSSWSRWYELIQLTFAWSRTAFQQSCGRGNLWLQGCTKHLRAVMASTDAATCRLNICSQLFIKDNQYISMVMCLAVHNTGLHLATMLPETGVATPFFSSPQPSQSTLLWEKHRLGSKWSGMEWKGEQGKRIALGHFSPCSVFLALVHLYAHDLMSYQPGWGHGQGAPLMELIVGAQFCGKLCVQVQAAPLR